MVFVCENLVAWPRSALERAASTSASQPSRSRICVSTRATSCARARAWVSGSVVGGEGDTGCVGVYSCLRGACARAACVRACVRVRWFVCVQACKCACLRAEFASSRAPAHERTRVQARPSTGRPNGRERRRGVKEREREKTRAVTQQEGGRREEVVVRARLRTPRPC